MNFVEYNKYIFEKENEIKNLKVEKGQKEKERSKCTWDLGKEENYNYKSILRNYNELSRQREQIKNFKKFKKSQRKKFIIAVLALEGMIMALSYFISPIIGISLKIPAILGGISLVVGFSILYAESLLPTKNLIKDIKSGNRNLGEELCEIREKKKEKEKQMDNLRNKILKLNFEINQLDKKIVIEGNSLQNVKTVLHNALEAVLKDFDLDSVIESTPIISDSDRTDKTFQKEILFDQ